MALKNRIVLEYCRLCQCEIGTISLENDNELLNKIFELTKVKIDNDLYDFLPQSICMVCDRKLRDISLFIDIVQKVDETLNMLARKRCPDRISWMPLQTNPINDFDENIEDTLECIKCPATFNDETILNGHLKSHNTTTPNFDLSLVCPVCKKLYRRPHSYEIHKKCHPECLCSICNVLFEDGDQLNIHKCREKDIQITPLNSDKTYGVLDISSNNFQCNSCGKTFNNKNSFAIHLKTHRKFICSKKNCLKVLPSYYSLKKHSFAHEGRRPFLCVTCGKSFLTKSSLVCHEKIHLDIKNYRCDLCDLSFSVRSNLRAHLRTYHEGVRFYCSQCTKVFVTKSSLDRHEKIHAGVKEFKCEECSSAFFTKKELTKHQRYHQGLKLYKCEECFKTFFERHHLTIHLRSHSGERPYVCNIAGCSKSFVSSQKLKRHTKSKHNALNAYPSDDNSEPIVVAV